MDLADRPDRPGADRLDHAPAALAGMPRVAHLGRDLVPRGRLRQHPRLVDRMGQRLLAVDVLAQLQRGLGDHGVRVIGSADDDGVDLLVQLVEHPAEVVEGLGLGTALGGRSQVVLIHVAERDDVLVQPGHRLVVVRPAAPHADQGDVQRFRKRSRRGRWPARQERRAPSPRRCARTGGASVETWRSRQSNLRIASSEQLPMEPGRDAELGSARGTCLQHGRTGVSSQAPAVREMPEPEHGCVTRHELNASGTSVTLAAVNLRHIRRWQITFTFL